MKTTTLLLTILLMGEFAGAEISVKKVTGELSVNFMDQKLWSQALPDETIGLLAQPVVVPKPTKTETQKINVAAIHDGKWIVFRVRWNDAEMSEANKLATFSDAVALQFPVKNNDVPPPIMMGGKGDPVHLFHWKYQYQLDAKFGKKPINEIYPNMTTDMYPMEFKEKGNYKEATKDQRDSFVGGTAAGNPQSFPKSGVDEIFAEGFGSSAVSDSHLAKGYGEWKKGAWTVWIARPLSYDNGSKLLVGKGSHVAFAVWQGGKKEIGALKSLTMMWTPFFIQEK
ncbi:MAG: hypothetical protein IT289_13435 [Oligoflexia bacterium]|nr:hypothetical protein [Oligoflexia bacterium]